MAAPALCEIFLSGKVVRLITVVAYRKPRIPAAIIYSMVGTIIIIVLLVNSSTDVLIVGTYPLLKYENIVAMANCTTHVSKVVLYCGFIG